MTNEKQLREEWEEYQPELNEKYFDEVKGSADWWLRKLHQEELNWITEQIERGKRMKRNEIEEAIQNSEGAFYPTQNEVEREEYYNQAITDFLAPLIERKKELEEIIGNKGGK